MHVNVRPRLARRAAKTSENLEMKKTAPVWQRRRFLDLFFKFYFTFVAVKNGERLRERVLTKRFDADDFRRFRCAELRGTLFFFQKIMSAFTGEKRHRELSGSPFGVVFPFYK